MTNQNKLELWFKAQLEKKKRLEDGTISGLAYNNKFQKAESLKAIEENIKAYHEFKRETE